VIALLLGEPDAERLLLELSAADEVAIGAPTLAEAGIVLNHRLGPLAASLLARLLAELDVVVLPFEERHARQALAANQRFGKGRHPAALNFGDCMAYATARLAARPLLATGRDFAQTDLPVA
jgi:ribonuclease VapC